MQITRSLQPTRLAADTNVHKRMTPKAGARPHVQRRRAAMVAASATAVIEAPAAAAEECAIASLRNLKLEGSTAAIAEIRDVDFHEMFSLGEVLGQGSYGTVRAASHVATGQQYAVKVLSKRKAGEERLEAIMREVRMWAMLSGKPHITELHGAYEDANNIFIVQELLTGGDLQSLLDAQGTLSEQEAAAAMHGVLSALSACHDAAICYGDVKPSNFMLASMYPSILHMLDPTQPKGDMALRLIDFGTSQYCPDGCAVLQGLSGTPVYMAPEVITDHCFSISMDVWAAGVMLYQMLTGQFPFWDTDMRGLGRIHPRQILKDVQNANVLIDAPVCAQLSDGAKDFFMKMLTKDPEQRISAAEALEHPWLKQQLQQQ